MLRRQPELARRALAVQLVRERTDNLKPSVESRLETQIRREGRVAEAGLDPSRTRRSDGHCRGRLESDRCHLRPEALAPSSFRARLLLPDGSQIICSEAGETFRFLLTVAKLTHLCAISRSCPVPKGIPHANRTAGEP
jgi:hypothetical protein